LYMACEILKDDPRYRGVVKIRVPSIYGPEKGAPLPARMARLVRAAAAALQNVYEDIVHEGGHLYITDMFRSAADQQRAHQDYLSGRKSAYSPPPCSSVHESGRAIDIDTLDTGIGHRRVREILNGHGWINIVDTLTGDECWHYEFRETKWQAYLQANGYPAMARAMKEEIGNLAGLAAAQSREAEILWLQTSLNKVLGAHLTVDGIYGPQTKDAVREFQRQNGLQRDGVAGPITKAKLTELVKEN